MKHVTDTVVTHHLQLTDQEIRLVAKGIQNLRNIREELLAKELYPTLSMVSVITEETADFALNTFHDTIRSNLVPEADHDENN